MGVSALTEVDASQLELLEELADRLDLATGKRKLEATFVDGKCVDLHFHGRTTIETLRCTCRRHAWSPSCPVHPSAAVAT